MLPLKLKSEKSHYTQGKLKLISQFTLITIILLACDTMSHFDAFSYKETISTKVEALDIMNFATEKYSKHEKEIHDLNLNLQKIYEYEKNRPKNVETTKMWEILLNPEKNLYGGFLKRWQNDTTLNKFFIDEAKVQVAEAFDMIIDLENGKIKKEQASEYINKF